MGEAWIVYDSVLCCTVTFTLSHIRSHGGSSAKLHAVRLTWMLKGSPFSTLETGFGGRSGTRAICQEAVVATQVRVDGGRAGVELGTCFEGRIPSIPDGLGMRGQVHYSDPSDCRDGVRPGWGGPRWGQDPERHSP